MSWASNHDASIEKLHRVQGSLTVDLIMVERSNFLVCSDQDTARDVKQRNKSDFSYLPVVDSDNQIIGLYDAERWFDSDAPDSSVKDDFHSLSEKIVIGADASIFDFIQQADTHPTNLVVSRNEIAGLVSLTDIQQLPVRAALFALITSLEMAMMIVVERRWPETDAWMAELSEGRRIILAEEIHSAQNNDAFINSLAFTQFCDKADLIRKARILSGTNKAVLSAFKNMRDLRDSVAHANSYADTPESAKKVCEVVRAVYRFKKELLEYISNKP